VTVVVVAVLLVALAVGIPVGMKKAKETVGLSGNNNVASAACGVTSYPDTCNQTLSGSSNGASTTSTGVTKLSVQSASTGVNNTKDSVMAMNYGANLTAAVEVCLESLGLSTDQLDQALQELSSSMNASARQKSMSDIQAWLTAAMEFHTTCIDAFMEISPADGRALQNQTSHTVELFSNALAFANALAAYGEDVMDWKPTGFSLPSNFSLSDLANTPLPKLPSFGNRRLLSSPELDLEESDEGFKLPSWVVDEHVQRHLLATPTSFNAIVAKDGSGDFESIQDAVDASLKDGMNDSSRYVIYIKAGEYKEQVKIPKSAVNLMLIGDGIDQTIITGNKSVALTPNMTTFKSATLSKFSYPFESEELTSPFLMHEFTGLTT
jgi:pectinesterase